MGDRNITSTTAIANTTLAQFAANTSTVTVVTDGGHTSGFSAAFLLNPDGSNNLFGWQTISYRALHEMAVKTKALAAAYAARPVKRAYAFGCSSGGRAVYNSAQLNPGDYDGILADSVSIDHTQLIPSLVWPQIVMQRDLADKGIPLPTRAQRDAVSLAALQACDASLTGQHDGFITNFQSCNYDPTKDASVLCTSDGGTNTTNACVNKAQAQVINKFWYGPTVDGSVPDPVADNGTSTTRPSSQLWWGRIRGSTLQTVANTDPATNAPAVFVPAMDQLAFNLQDISITTPAFVTPTARGQNGWMNLTYAQNAQAYAQGKLLNETAWANYDAVNPDLTGFRNAGAKMISFHGVADQNVNVVTSINYFTRNSARMGGDAATQAFHRLFLVPGRGHCTGTGSVGGGGNPPQVSVDQMYERLVDWVENNNAPTTILATSADGAKSRPLCMYPRKQKYVGGDVNAASSFTCE